MKKALILLLAAIIGIGLFVSCSNEPSYDSLKGKWTHETFDDTRGGMKTVIEFDGLGKFIMSEWTSTSPFPVVMVGTYSTSGGYLHLNDTSLDIPSRHTQKYPAVMFMAPDEDPDDDDPHTWLMVTDNDEGPYKFDDKPMTADWWSYKVNENGKQFVHGTVDDHAYIYDINDAENPTKLVFHETQVFTDGEDKEMIYSTAIEWEAVAAHNAQYDPATGIHFLKYYDEKYTKIETISKFRQDGDKLYVYRGEKEVEYTR